MESTKGRIHSIETFSTVDGPGIRSVVFLQGCPLRCQYCHNPDTWDAAGGVEKSAEEIASFLERYKGYYKASGGGVTISGGEPCMQPAFVIALMQECKKRGMHVALDTSGWASTSVLTSLLPHADLVLLDIKHIDAVKHQELTGRDNAPILGAARLITQLGVPLWVRHVLVPGLTDDAKHLGRLAEYITTFTTLTRLDILPYHRMGEHKWAELNMEYPLKGVKPPTKEQLERAKQIFRSYGLPVDGMPAKNRNIHVSHAS
jgi:pyruvate formate lyase activating enzyme